MNRAIFSIMAVLALLSACGSDNSAVETESSAEVPTSKTDVLAARTSAIQSPVQITYRVIGTPIIGSPVALDLQFTSALGDVPYKVTFRVNDPTAMHMPEGQSESISIAPSSDNESVSRQVTVIPLREGRLYLNVAAVVETESGSMQSVVAIPIQVGPAAPRQLQENGTVTTDDQGDLIRTLPAKEK